MGLKGIDRVYADLPRGGGWDVRHVAQLRQGAGPKIKAEETLRYAEILRQDWARFSEPARRQLEALAGEAAPDVRATRFKMAGRYHTDIAEQSGVTFVSAALGFLVVDDESSTIWRLPFPTKDSGRLHAEEIEKNDRHLVGLEGATYDADSRSLLVVSEASGKVLELDLRQTGDRFDLGAANSLGKLPEINTEPNKGWEGLTVLAGQQAADRRAHLLAVHEGFPRALGIFDRHTLETEQILELPPSLSPHPKDLSDVAIDPRTGHLFLLSDESGAIYECELRRTVELLGQGAPVEGWALVKIGETPLPKKLGKNVQAEGLCFDHLGDLWVTYERGEGMVRFARDPD